MVKQDPRVAESALEDVNDFFTCIKENNNDLVEGFISVEPTLIYALDPSSGYTALHLLIRSSQKSLETLNVLLKAAAAAGVVPDLTITNEMGADAMRMLAVLEGKEIHSDFWAALLPYMADYYDAVANAARAETDAYFARSETIEGQKATNNAEKNDGGKKGFFSKFFQFNVQLEEDSDIFSKLNNNPYYNLDEQKARAQATDYLKLPNFDFIPKTYLSTISSSDDLSILMVPSALTSFSIEQITGFITQLGFIAQLSAHLIDNTDA